MTFFNKTTSEIFFLAFFLAIYHATVFSFVYKCVFQAEEKLGLFLITCDKVATSQLLRQFGCHNVLLETLDGLKSVLKHLDAFC